MSSAVESLLLGECEVSSSNKGDKQETHTFHDQGNLQVTQVMGQHPLQDASRYRSQKVTVGAPEVAAVGSFDAFKGI